MLTIKADFHSVLFVALSIFCDHFLLNCEPSTGSVPVEGSQFKRKLSQKVDRATKSTEWESSFRCMRGRSHSKLCMLSKKLYRLNQ